MDAELNALRLFWMEVRDCFLRNDAPAFEYDEFLDLGTKLGLLVVEDYEPEGKHADLELAGDVEEGSPVYVPTDLAKAPPESREGPFDRKRFEKAPCYRCGYNGPYYFQRDTHLCADLYHASAPPEEPR